MQENKLNSTPMLKLIISMSLPAMFSMLVQALYNIVDSIFVAQYSKEALDAVSYAFPIQMLMVAVSVGTGVGVNSLVARKLGEKNQHDADSAATHGIVLSAISWVIFLVFGLFFAEPFFKAFTDNQQIVIMGKQYLSILCIFSLGSFIQIAIEKILQGTGDMIMPMAGQLIGAITNIILDPIMIFGYFGFPKMGIAGAAIATVIGQIVAMIFLVLVIIFKKHLVTINFKDFKFSSKTVKNIYTVGFPSIIMQSIASVLIMGLNAILGAISDVGVTILGVYYKLQSFVFMPVFGLTQGLMPIMGYNYGARNKKRLIDAMIKGMIIAVIIMTLGTFLFWLQTDTLLEIFKANEDMLKEGIPALRIISLCFVPAALGITFSTVFQSTGMGLYSLVVSLLRQLVLILPIAYFMSAFGLVYVWSAFPIAEIGSFVVSIYLYYRLYRKNIKYL